MTTKNIEQKVYDIIVAKGLMKEYNAKAKHICLNARNIA